jgi:hypothetical protein
LLSDLVGTATHRTHEQTDGVVAVDPRDFGSPLCPCARRLPHAAGARASPALVAATEPTDCNCLRLTTNSFSRPLLLHTFLHPVYSPPPRSPAFAAESARSVAKLQSWRRRHRRISCTAAASAGSRPFAASAPSPRSRGHPRNRYTLMLTAASCFVAALCSLIE